jgi:hypothetical protein
VTSNLVDLQMLYAAPCPCGRTGSSSRQAGRQTIPVDGDQLQLAASGTGKWAVARHCEELYCICRMHGLQPA